MTPSIQLRTGSNFPQIGLGTWKIDNALCAPLVKQAVQAGYRHFDCACDYGNEAEVGNGFREVLDSGLCKREDLWITSKLWNTYHRPEHVRQACERTLADLQVDYVDLYLIHFPITQKFVPFEERYPPGWFADPNASNPKIECDPVPIADTWGAMEALKADGLAKDIGVCNFGTSLLRDLMSYASTPPAVLQVESHPYLLQDKLLRFCNENEIVYTAFSPLGSLSYHEIGMADADDTMLELDDIKQIAAAHGRTPAQVLLRWGVQRNTVLVPKTSRPERLTENIQIFDFELSADEMQAISQLDKHRRYNDPGDFAEKAFNTFFPIYE